MYIEALQLKNIKLLENLELSFQRSDGQLRNWTVIVGDNGLCKTTILQAIAMAASGEKLTRAFVSDAQDYRGPANHEPGVIDATFQIPSSTGRSLNREGKNHSSLRYQLRVEPGTHDFAAKGSGTIDDLRSERIPGYFVAAYGVGRSLPKPEQVVAPRDPMRNRVESLFDIHHPLLGIDFFKTLREQGGAPLAKAYARLLRDVLVSEDEGGERLLPALTNVELRGQGGVSRMEQLLGSRRFSLQVGNKEYKLPPSSLSSGYQSMVAWISDLLGHVFLEHLRAREYSGSPGQSLPGSLEELRGVVLLDELELHLHPQWQRRVIPILRKVFPSLQFIVTTHSPLILAGVAAEEIVQLELDGDHVVRTETPVSPTGLSATSILNHYFGVARASPAEFVLRERRYIELKAKSRLSKKDKLELEELEKSVGRALARKEDLDTASNNGSAPLLRPSDIRGRVQ